ncbi:hypothetical protein F4805DRAFT_476733 [Annulohypoxylon moriforme]|nr:hypothetical protein F4805DRAFT_476733 [Annulohypoxylon moriforme]
MEVLGAVAAVGQLVGTVITIIESISQICDFLRHAPARYQGWRCELAVLRDTITAIRDTKALHTCSVSRIITSMAPKISRLMELCANYSSEPKQRLITKLNRALKAKNLEVRILQVFESLERDKTTLILTISTLSRATQAKYPKEIRNMQNNGSVKEDESNTGNQDRYMNQGTSQAVVPFPVHRQTHTAYNNNLAQTQSSLPNSTRSDPHRLLSDTQRQRTIEGNKISWNGDSAAVGLNGSAPAHNPDVLRNEITGKGDFSAVGINEKDVALEAIRNAKYSLGGKNHSGTSKTTNASNGDPMEVDGMDK